MIVLDASAWVEMLLGTHLPPSPEEEIRVPPHFDVEVLGMLRSLAQRGVLSDEDASSAMARHLRAPFDSERHEDDIRQAWSWREAMSFGDGWYTAMALRLNATWLTTDGRAAPTAQRLGARTARPDPAP